MIDLLMRRREMTKNILPYDAEVEYLRSSGTQYIDTGITYSSSDAYVIECGIAIHNSGTLTGNGWDAGGLFGQLTGKPTNGDGNSFGVNIQNTYVVMTLTINAGTSTQSVLSVNVNGTTYSRGRAHSSLGTYASTYGYLLFAVRSKTSISYKASESIYYCKIKKNNILVRNLIPVRVGQVGYLYDKVSGQLFGNSGTGSFTYGNDLPYDAKVEWLEFTGLQAINTGIYPTSLDITMEYTSYNHPKWGWAYNGDADKTWICSGGNRVYWHNWNTSYRYDISDYNANTWNTWKYDMQNGFWKNDAKVSTFSASISNTQISSIPLYIGQYWDLSISSIHDSAPVNARVSHWKISKGGVLVRDYIPVRKDGVGYLYDRISGTLFGNDGSGSFTYGNDVS